MLKEEIQLLKNEIAILKGQKPRPKIPPSTLEGPHSKEKQKDKPPRGKHPRRKKTNQLQIHVKERIKPAGLPEGAVFKGCNKYTVQNIIIRSNNTLYELERWQLPDGTYVTGKLPEHVLGHYGPDVVAYVLHQYYGCRVAAPLLLAQLHNMGVLISEGQLSKLLIEGKAVFHQEKCSLLPAGIAATGQLKVDDTGARLSGKNGYSTIIANELFTYVSTTMSKSRVNFLQTLHGGVAGYLVNEDAAEYIKHLKPLSWLQGHLLMHRRENAMNQKEWEQFLTEINVAGENDVRLATEAALYASLISSGIPKDLGVHGDDAGQFDVFVRSLCWIHEERHYRKLIAIDDTMRIAIEQVREGIWELYQDLKSYKEAPSETCREAISKKFDQLFTQTTASPTLNNQLAKTYAKKEELLRVLARPTTPLHNNGTETDAREMKTKLKVSGGTRSAEGLACRDTFVSLKKTCIKLGINFWNYLLDRVQELFTIPPLAEIIRKRGAFQSQGP
ncbi:MAG: IS66 family transposase [Ktedonobacteraceae bacterium]